MPSLGADMDSGKVVEWRVKPGDSVEHGDIVAVVETEKSAIEVEIFESGVIGEILVPIGETVPVGTALARVTSNGPAAAIRPVPSTVLASAIATHSVVTEPYKEESVAPGRVVSPLVRHEAEHLHVDVGSLVGTGPGGKVTRADVDKAAESEPVQSGARVRSSPFARRLAGQRGIDISSLSGTGPGGTVVEKDVLLAIGADPQAPVPSEKQPPPAQQEMAAADKRTPEAKADVRQANMRKAIGALMARSKREIPHYYLSTTVDMSAATLWLEKENLERPITERFVMAVLLMKATALALARVPEMNGFYIDDGFVPSRAVHLGVAVSLRTGGVIAPAIHNADTLSLGELMGSLRDLVGRARRGVLRSSEMSDPTITVTNLGDLGVESVFGVIYPPQVAIVGFGRVVERPWACEGMVGVRPCMTATLAADHRVSDGHRGGVFLAEIDQLLQEPEKLR